MHPYGIGLDIGVTSVGWAVLALDGEEKPRGIIDMGSRIFDAAEHPKTGASLALPRREARSARRRLRRLRHRKERIRELLVSSGLLGRDELDRLFDGQLTDIYALRVKALDEKLSREEFARVLLHLAQRRGFRSNRKNAGDKEEGKLLEAVGENKKRMEAMGYRTAGEMLLKDQAFAQYKRNKGGQYIATITRDMTEDEARKIFAAQRNFGADFAGAELEEAYLEILLSQRSFDEGPGGNSPYGGSQIGKMIGKCTFEEGELRAAKASYSFEYFTLLQKINHIRILRGGESRPLTGEERKKLVELAHKTENLNYLQIRKELGLTPEERFNTLRYSADDGPETAEKKEKFCYLKAYHQMRRAAEKACKGSFAALSIEQRNAVGTILSIYKTSENVRKGLSDAGIPEILIDQFEGLNFSKFGHLSVKACDRLIPCLEQGMNYNEACAAAGYDFRGHNSGEKSFTLPPLPDDQNEITSPVVLRAVSQTIKVVNAIIRKQGASPTYINIELAREMAKDFSERKKLEKEMDENRAKNERAMERIRNEYGKTDATGQDLVKLKLYEEQGGVCAYSQKQMSLARLFEPNYAEVEHIVPYSISFDDSYKNKVLVLMEENRNKGNRLPLQYLTGQRRENFIVWVNRAVRDQRKKRLLLKEDFTQEEKKKLRERNLNDTKFMTSFMLNYIQDYLIFAPSDKKGKKRVTAVNGAITAYMRKRWGITKIREDGDLHHAVDAVVIACTTDGMIQQVSRYAASRECEYSQTEAGSLAVDPRTGEVLRKFPYPWPQFRKELEARLCNDPSRVIADLRLPFYMEEDAPEVRPLLVSRKPRRKISGPVHEQTARSIKKVREGYSVTKCDLTSLKLKNGEIEGYFRKEDDRLLYEALKNRLVEYGGDGKKAFKEPFYKPKKDGSPGPLVKKVKIEEKAVLSVPIQKVTRTEEDGSIIREATAVANNDTLVRIDVFCVEGDGYYFVPIYVVDTLKKELPNRACVARKGYGEWKEMKEEDFVFSLYPYDLIKVTQKREFELTKVNEGSTLPPAIKVKSIMLYYKGADRDGARIKCITHDNTYNVRLGIKTLEKIEKYTVDVLGEYHPVKKEKRQGFGGKGA